jgi:hypothetical protein
MFTTRVRKTALSLAGAAIVATSLMTSIAAAAPVESLPLPPAAESVAAKPRIDIPVADLSVTPLSLSHDAAYQNVHYRFRIANNGPDRMTFKYQMKAYWLASGQPNGTQDGGTYTVTKNSGEYIDVDMFCQIGGDPSHTCGAGEVTVTSINSLDNNTSNNSAKMYNNFQP